MEVTYSSNRLKKQLSTERERAKNFGTLGPQLNRRLNNLAAAEDLETMRVLPGHCHELHGDREGQLAVDLSGNYRLVFEPDHDPVPTKDDGGLDWTKVTKICVLEVEDYHGD